MNLRQPYSYVVLKCLLFCLLAGCQGNYTFTSFVKVEKERTKLINGIESYQNIVEFKGFLSHSSYQWEASEDPPSTSSPPFHQAVVTIRDYSHLGFTGELYVIFFNNRLYSTIFYPPDIEKYIEVIEKTIGTKFNNDQELIMPPHTSVRIATDYKGRKYINWSDVRLDKEVDLWIDLYS